METPSPWTRSLRALAGHLKRIGLLDRFRVWCVWRVPPWGYRQGGAKPEHLADAIMSVFWVCDDLPADKLTRVLLEQILSHPQILERTGDNFLVEHLEHMLPGEPELVFRLCREAHPYARTGVALDTDVLRHGATHLTNIALTLQRLGGEHRGRGLALFEQLLALGVPDAQSTLNELDQRLSTIPPSIPCWRRRRGGG